jgi:hypothetical protein
MTVLNGVPSMIACILTFVLVPRNWRAVRAGTAVYALGVIAAWVFPTGVGSNVERLGLLLVGPLLVASVTKISDTRRKGLLIFGLIGAVVWQVVSPIRDLAHSDAPLTSAAATAPLIRELTRIRADRGRVEAVPQYGHWEAQQLAATVPLARGWERQIDTVRNPLFYSGTLTASEYHRWLRNNAVQYVAISSAKPDYAAKSESDIVNSHQPWLTPVWHDAQWRLFRVSDTNGLASQPATMVRTTPASITLTMPKAGSTLERVRWSKFLHASGSGTLRQQSGWTRLSVDKPGRYVLSATY